jgi:hypothetical protein
MGNPALAPTGEISALLQILCKRLTGVEQGKIENAGGGLSTAS